MRIASVAVLALLSSVALTSCNGDDAKTTSSKETTTTTEKAAATKKSTRSDADHDALVKYILGADKSVMTEESSQCVGDATVDELTDAGLAIVKAGGDFDLTKFADADSAALVSGLDKCVDIDVALTTFSKAISTEAGLPLTADEAACTSKEFAAQYSGTGAFIKAITAMTDQESGSAFFKALGPCISDATAVTFMSEVLAKQKMDAATATCVATSMVTQLGAKGLMDAINDAGASGNTATLGQASSTAAGACSAAPTGG